MEPIKPYSIATLQPAPAEEIAPQMLVLTFRDGRRTAISYSYLYRVDFNGVDAITLHFVSDVVTLRGRDLASVFDRLHQQSEACLVEVDPLHTSPTEAGGITSIDIAPKRGNHLSDA